MNHENPSVSQAAVLSLDEVLALYRRICVLQQQQRPIDAETLRSEQFSPALNELRSSGKFSEDEIEARFRSERQRVEDTALLAELLAPLIQAQLPTTESVKRADATPNRKPAPVSATKTPRPDSSDQHAPITAFIDEMLSQKNSRERRA